ncbi:DUF456 domain-containing protein [Nocardioides dubius]|uniref:DUF456 domain-containing protein n=1 Tax=Nocardioides dubius TaxID=317019 RepID=A0ABP4EBA5_9ACTN
MSGVELLCALAIAIGIVGIVVPILPGTLLVLAAVIVWGFHIGGATAWAVVALAIAILGLGTVVKYLVPGRQLKSTGVPATSMLTGAVLGIVGFFVVPIVGIVIGFVLGLYLAEWQRVGERAARGTTWAAVRAVGLSILIEAIAAMAAAFVWVVGVVAT